MLFNSYTFIFLFFPIAVSIYYFAGSRGYYTIALSWLVVASLFFYGWWNPVYLILILTSIIFNYSAGLVLDLDLSQRRRFWTLFIGISANLGLLGYFKYANFFVDNINNLVGSEFHLETIILPLAISFFTFQQITYLVDTYKGITKEHNFLHYCLFVTFFPQLIAGPIVHHNEMLPQFTKLKTYWLDYGNLAIGLSIFFLGLFKKVVFADGIAEFANPTFDSAETGIAPAFFEAWGAALAYTFQLYFDFSGYSDMAIGIARTFGIVLPLNFNSPYKAQNIIGFWRRWHMTLSRFLRDYLYIPLGGNRKGRLRRYINIITVMLLGGLWHGAGWTFVIWGLLHGIYLIINHGWHAVRRIFSLHREGSTFVARTIARTITFIAVVVAWVFFRAESLDGALLVLQGMLGENGFFLPLDMKDKLGAAAGALEQAGVIFSIRGNSLDQHWLGSLLVVALAAFILPNTQQFTQHLQGRKDILQNQAVRVQLSYSLGWLLVLSIIAIIAIISVSRGGEFLYFNF